jgi:hypothetical protein
LGDFEAAKRELSEALRLTESASRLKRNVILGLKAVCEELGQEEEAKRYRAMLKAPFSTEVQINGSDRDRE